MHSLARLIGLSVLLLGLFLLAALGAQGWLRRHSAQMQEEAVAKRRAQFAGAIELGRLGPPPWTTEQLAALGRTIDARISLGPTTAGRPETDPGQLAFDAPILDAAGQVAARAHVVFPAPALLRLHLAHARTWVILLVLAVGIVLAVMVVSFFSRRSPSGGAGESRQPWPAARQEMDSWEQLAKASAEQSSALTRERDARQRTERDLALNQRLLNQSLEEKIRLGRDLHDGLIQSLYAAGLTIESARPLLKDNPDEAGRRLLQCRETLNQAIRDVRAYIAGLAPDQLRRINFASAVELFLAELRGGREVGLSLDIDDEAAGALLPAQLSETLQLTHEAISNGLRHGRASQIDVRLHRTDREIGLLVQDNGAGFDPASRAGGGHGLGNMRARAAAIGATLRIDSRAGHGTRVVLTLPLQPS